MKPTSLYSKIAKRVFKFFKKYKKGNWQEAQKFASKNIYPVFKGRGKVTLKEIDSEIKKILFPLNLFNFILKRAYSYIIIHNLGFTIQKVQKICSVKIFPKFKGTEIDKIDLKELDKIIRAVFRKEIAPEICFNPYDIPLTDLENVQYWDIVEAFAKFDDLLNVKFDMDQVVNTGIIKKNESPSILEIREKLRIKYNNGSDGEIIFRILKVPEKQNDKKPCSYYLYIIEEDSSQNVNTRLEASQLEAENRLKLRAEVPKREMPKSPTEKETPKEIEIAKKEIKQIKRPEHVEGTERAMPSNETTPAVTDKDKEIIILKEKNEILKQLTEGYQRGDFTKKVYNQLVINLFNK